MNLHEYQCKELFRNNGIPVPQGTIIKNPNQVEHAIKSLSGSRFVAKAQVHAGGRGKAGGVLVSDSITEIEQFCKKLLGTRLVTYQSGSDGQPVDTILIEEALSIQKEFYFGIVLDRSKRCLVAMASSEGGVEIEKVAEESPDKIVKEAIDPLVGFLPFQGRRLGFALGLTLDQVTQFTAITTKLVELYLKKDFSLLEINPLIETNLGTLLCADGKVTIDDNALFRQRDLEAINDTHQEKERERIAKEQDLSYISLDGNIGCMVNGAGLAMATMDIIKLHGGEPANFLDVGGTADAKRVANAFKIILSDSNVKAILVNIFGGIVKCDLIAEGIQNAMKEVSVNVPVTVRLQGTNAEQGLKMLSASGMKIITANSLEDAANKVVTSIS
ncbi:MAG: ADP-forming succinate--CoA ligase subunit beta [Methylacidiphilales bacterium]|nr:ADP-forming succinate--CoA ligase subunit beta [Candidatus Methylacidiphilales bacterium]